MSMYSKMHCDDVCDYCDGFMNDSPYNVVPCECVEDDPGLIKFHRENPEAHTVLDELDAEYYDEIMKWYDGGMK